MKVDAEHFIENHNSDFIFQHNPFKFDISGKPISNLDCLNLSNHLNLKADLSTLRICCWQKSEAYVISNPTNAPYSPRLLLQSLLCLPSPLLSLQISSLTFQLLKTTDTPNLSDHLTSTNMGVLMTDTCHRNIMAELRKKLSEGGIPIDVV